MLEVALCIVILTSGKHPPQEERKRLPEVVTEKIETIVCACELLWGCDKERRKVILLGLLTRSMPEWLLAKRWTTPNSCQNAQKGSSSGLADHPMGPRVRRKRELYLFLT